MLLAGPPHHTLLTLPPPNKTVSSPHPTPAKSTRAVLVMFLELIKVVQANNSVGSRLTKQPLPGNNTGAEGDL